MFASWAPYVSAMDIMYSQSHGERESDIVRE